MNKNSKFAFSKFIFSLVLNSAVLLLALFVYKPFFEELDDTNIAMIVEGAFGNKEWHVIYPNVILGKIYVLLQTYLPGIRWHVILQYVFIYIAYVFLVYVIAKHNRGLFVSVLAVLASFYELYVSIQYTKTAAFVCLTGYVLIFEAVRYMTDFNNASDTLLNYDEKKCGKECKIFIIVAFVLFLYGVLLRPEAIFIAGVPALAAGMLELFRTKNIKMYVLLFFPIFISTFLLQIFNDSVYSKDQEWSHFMEYNKARMELNDYRYDIFDFSKYKKELDELNVSENDALAILTYQYADDDIFSLERFKEIRAPFPNREFGYVTFANLYENIMNEFKRSYTLLAGLIGCLLILIASIVIDRSKSSPGFIKDSRRKMFCMILMGISCFSALVYFQYSGRFSHRLLGALVIPAMFLASYIIDSIYIKENESKIIFGGNHNDITIQTALILSVVVIALNVLLYFANVSDYMSAVTENSPIIRELNEIAKDKDSLYVADTFTFQNVYKYEVFNVFEQGALSNFVTCGSWYVNSPITRQITEEFGYRNPFEALRSTEANVYLLDNLSTDCKMLFLKEHYDKVYSVEKLENRGGIDVFHVFIKE